MILELLLGALIKDHTRKTVTTSLGGHMHPCNFCGQLQPHEIMEIKKKDTLNFTSLDGYAQQYMSQCEVCRKQTTHKGGILPSYIERWTPDSNFHDYARRSGHPSIDPNLSVKTPASIGALLKSSTTPTEKTRAITPKDYFLLISVFILSILLGIIAYGMSTSSSSGGSDLNFYIYGLGVPFAGFFFGVFLVNLKKRKEAQAKQLEEFNERMMRLNITSDDILTNMPQSLLQKRKIYALVKPMMHGSR